MPISSIQVTTKEDQEKFRRLIAGTHHASATIYVCDPEQYSDDHIGYPKLYEQGRILAEGLRQVTVCLVQLAKHDATLQANLDNRLQVTAQSKGGM